MNHCNKCNKDYEQKRCPHCNYETQKAWRAKNKEKWAAYRKQYARKSVHTATYEKSLSGLMMRLLARAKARMKDDRGARKRVEGFDIDRQFLIDLWYKQDGRCAVSGLALELVKDSLKCASLDRRDSDIGYLQTNVQLVCKWVNLAKKDYPNDAMLAVIAEIRGEKQT